MAQSYFSPAVFTFLKDVAANNNRPWWEDNKDRYISLIREPAKEFIEDFGPRLQAISEHFVADSRTNGGSLMRPYRDTRFSKDKTPYKTNIGIQFRHERGKDVHAPGFYIHIAPERLLGGCGAVAAGSQGCAPDSRWHLRASRRLEEGHEVQVLHGCLVDGSR